MQTTIEPKKALLDQLSILIHHNTERPKFHREKKIPSLCKILSSAFEPLIYIICISSDKMISNSLVDEIVMSSIKSLLVRKFKTSFSFYSFTGIFTTQEKKLFEIAELLLCLF